MSLSTAATKEDGLPGCMTKKDHTDNSTLAVDRVSDYQSP
jgi:hypothetical protein